YVVAAGIAAAATAFKLFAVFYSIIPVHEDHPRYRPLPAHAEGNVFPPGKRENVLERIYAPVRRYRHRLTGYRYYHLCLYWRLVHSANGLPAYFTAYPAVNYCTDCTRHRDPGVCPHPYLYCAGWRGRQQDCKRTGQYACQRAN